MNAAPVWGEPRTRIEPSPQGGLAPLLAEPSGRRCAGSRDPQILENVIGRERVGSLPEGDV